MRPPDRVPLDEETKGIVIRRDHNVCLCCGVSKRLNVDHIRPRYYGGDNSLDNLQTLCNPCNTLKGIHKFDFRAHQTRLTEPPATFPTPQPPTGEIDRDAEWGRFVKRYVNMFFQCAAVDEVDIGQRGGRFHDWRVMLRPNNEPAWASKVAEAILRVAAEERRKVGRGFPSTITLGIPGQRFVTVKARP